jgi:hypothetical protein
MTFGSFRLNTLAAALASATNSIKGIRRITSLLPKEEYILPADEGDDFVLRQQARGGLCVQAGKRGVRSP